MIRDSSSECNVRGDTPSSLHRIVLVIAWLALGLAATARAQDDPAKASQTTDVDQRRHFVRLTSGEEFSGRLLKSGNDEVRLLVNGRERIVRLDQVVRVERSGDSLRNGAFIGALVAGAWCALVCGQGLASSGQVPLAVAANAGLGALVGAGIDAAHRGRTLVYPRPSPVALGRGSRPSVSFRFGF